MSATYKTKLLLAFRSGDRCAMPGCERSLTRESGSGDPFSVGEAAHIAGEKSDAVRYDPSMTNAERDDYRNLIYLCADCHKVIDDKQHGAADYPVESLQKMKLEHEQRVRNAVSDAFSEVGFPELEEATEWVFGLEPECSANEFTIVPPDDKIRRNELGSRSRHLVVMGLALAGEVRSYVETVAHTDPDFPNRLKAGFLEEYYRLRKKKLAGDDLFDLMCDFAQRGFSDVARKAAGLAVLVYLFESCDVFEK